MRGIAGKRLYDTEASEELFTVRKDTVYEHLHRTKKGNYFLLSEPRGVLDSRDRSSITPLDKDGVIAWLESANTDAAVEFLLSEFAEEIEEA